MVVKEGGRSGRKKQTWQRLDSWSFLANMRNGDVTQQKDSDGAWFIFTRIDDKITRLTVATGTMRRVKLLPIKDEGTDASAEHVKSGRYILRGDEDYVAAIPTGEKAWMYVQDFKISSGKTRYRWERICDTSRRAAGVRPSAAACTKRGSIGQMQTLAELVPILESSVKAP